MCRLPPPSAGPPQSTIFLSRSYQPTIRKQIQHSRSPTSPFLGLTRVVRHPDNMDPVTAMSVSIAQGRSLVCSWSPRVITVLRLLLTSCLKEYLGAILPPRPSGVNCRSRVSTRSLATSYLPTYFSLPPRSKTPSTPRNNNARSQKGCKFALLT